MAEINLQKRAVYVTDVYAAMVKAGYEDATCFIQGLPSADVATVVRCKDCKYWEPISYYHRTDGVCLCLSKYHDAGRPMTEGDFYCAYGKRAALSRRGRMYE